MTHTGAGNMDPMVPRAHPETGQFPDSTRLMGRCYCLNCRSITHITPYMHVFLTGFVRRDGRDYQLGICMNEECYNRTHSSARHKR